MSVLDLRWSTHSLNHGQRMPRDLVAGKRALTRLAPRKAVRNRARSGARDCGTPEASPVVAFIFTIPSSTKWERPTRLEHSQPVVQSGQAYLPLANCLVVPRLYRPMFERDSESAQSSYGIPRATMVQDRATSTAVGDTSLPSGTRRGSSLGAGPLPDCARLVDAASWHGIGDRGRRRRWQARRCTSNHLKQDL